jgi:hypothetical protein
MRSLFLAAGMFAALVSGIPRASAQSQTPAPPSTPAPPAAECQRGATAPAAPGETTGRLNQPSPFERFVSTAPVGHFAPSSGGTAVRDEDDPQAMPLAAQQASARREPRISP